MYRCHVVVLVSWFAGKTVQLPSSTVNPFKYELGIEPTFWAKSATLKVEPTLCAEMPLAHKVPT